MLCINRHNLLQKFRGKQEEKNVEYKNNPTKFNGGRTLAVSPWSQWGSAWLRVILVLSFRVAVRRKPHGSSPGLSKRPRILVKARTRAM
jgi:hypothetical protein